MPYFQELVKPNQGFGKAGFRLPELWVWGAASVTVRGISHASRSLVAASYDAATRGSPWQILFKLVLARQYHLNVQSLAVPSRVRNKVKILALSWQYFCSAP